MKTVYLVRHGEAESNLDPDIVQAGESPLTEKGREQAEKIAERAMNIDFDVMIASTMRRTQETARVIAAKKEISFESTDILVERRIPTTIVGQSMSDECIKEKMKAWELSTVGKSPRVDDGDNLEDLWARAGKVLKMLEERPEESILMVGHGFMTSVIVARMWYGAAFAPEKIEPLQWGLRTVNTGLTVLKYDPEDAHRSWWLHVWNDHTHLG